MKVQWDGKSSRPIKIAYVIRYGNFDWSVWIPFYVHGTSNLKLTVCCKHGDPTSMLKCLLIYCDTPTIWSVVLHSQAVTCNSCCYIVWAWLLQDLVVTAKSRPIQHYLSHARRPLTGLLQQNALRLSLLNTCEWDTDNLEMPQNWS